jgi:hypothetical protein
MGLHEYVWRLVPGWRKNAICRKYFPIMDTLCSAMAILEFAMRHHQFTNAAATRWLGAETGRDGEEIGRRQ